jgi:uncharacterized membrane protein YhiD involved in acid resistance
MPVALASALFVIVPLALGTPSAESARIAQGVDSGIGFIGAGAVLELSENREIQRLTTAAAIWTTAAVGMTVGLGGFGIVALDVTLAWFILPIIGHITKYLDCANEKQNPDAQKGNASDPPKTKRGRPEQGRLNSVGRNPRGPRRKGSMLLITGYLFANRCACNRE